MSDQEETIVYLANGRVLRCVRWYFLIPDGGAHKRVGPPSEWECTLDGSRIDQAEAKRLIEATARLTAAEDRFFAPQGA